MEINIVCVGNLKEKYWIDAINEYKKRLSAFAKVNIIETKESRYLDSQQELLRAKREESENLAKYKKGYCFALEVGGKTYSSTAFSEKIKNLQINGISQITFFIGGSVGLDENFSKSCNEQISFSCFTMPHQLIRVVLIEQIYRAFMINANKTYHK